MRRLGSLLFFVGCAACAGRAEPRAPASDVRPTPFTSTERTASSQARRWWYDATFYEVFVRSFADADGDGVGDFDGLTAHLDDLTALGVDALWLMPIHPSPSYHGYDVVDYRAVHPDYGGDAAFDRFMVAAKQAGLRVVIDFVMNHSSTEHPWFRAARAGPTAPTFDYYLWRDTMPTKGFVRPWDGAPAWHALGDRYYYALFWSGMPDLNLGNPKVEAELVGAMQSWIDRGVDGFRVDAARHFFETEDGVVVDAPETFEFAKRIHSKVDALLIAEAWASVEQVAPYADGFDLAFGFDTAGAIKTALRDGARAEIVQTLARAKKTYAPTYEAPFLSNHDMPRVMRTLDDERKMRVAAALLFAMSGTPFLYYGEEIGMRGGPNPDDRDKRTPMRWTGEAPGFGFTTGTPWHQAEEAPGVDVATQRRDPDSLWNLYRRLIALRKEHPAMRGAVDVHRVGGGRGVIVLEKRLGEESILFVANVHDGPSEAFTLEHKGEPKALLTEGIAAPKSWRFDALPPLSFGFFRAD